MSSRNVLSVPICCCISKEAYNYEKNKNNTLNNINWKLYKLLLLYKKSTV